MSAPPSSVDCLCAGIVVADFVCAPVPRIPPAGGLEMTDAIAPTIGGCASNVAIDLARLGRRAIVVGRIGSDMPGRFVRESLAAGGVDTARLVESSVPTSSTLVINVRHEDRRFIHAFGANALFDGSEITPALVRQAKVLYLGGFGLMPRLSGDRVAELFRAAREAHVPTVLDVVVPDPVACRAELNRVLPWTDVFLPNTDEARLLTGLADPLEQAREFRAAGAGTVVITCGSQGAVLASPADTLRAGAFQVEFVDGTGSGDAFAAGFITGLIDGSSPERCLAIGSALGASCVRQAGATTGVFTRDELADFLSRHRLPVERVSPAARGR
jgi:sugar/nucleoside kinase (ribokinase family)